ncbi:MAG: phosphodiesterase [Methanomassiliicoccales archaeon PtaU1.Bin124]|nr:MAG: phosphodiesterase [Methanomassiliicoccales archaeon PtaU1.Bin124]
MFLGFIDVRIGFISDVHANVIALRAVLEELDDRRVDIIYNAGDLIGYYPYPSETIELLRRRAVVSIRGNHDRSVLSVDTNRMNPWAASAVSWTAGHLDPEGRRYLERLTDSLDFTIGEMAGSMHHGSPDDEDEYIFEERAGQYLLESAGTRLLVLGHTHIPFVKRVSRGVIINPGSVGQPRDGDRRSSCLVYDVTSGEFENVRVDYDIGEVQEAVLEVGLPSSLAERLAHGW